MSGVSQVRCPPWSPASRSDLMMSCRRTCRRRWRQEVHPDVCTSGGTSKCGSATSRSGCIAADAQVEANRQAREEAGDTRQRDRCVALDTRTGVEERTWSEWAGQSSVARQIDAGKMLCALESEAAADDKISRGAEVSVLHERPWQLTVESTSTWISPVRSRTKPLQARSSSSEEQQTTVG